ncbi:MAG TPA: DUF998 domain-containing protein [Chitinivibrionales bacterium]|nr:DUF998 domain-containing protein [Chitinivibrionales bacterium]
MKWKKRQAQQRNKDRRAAVLVFRNSSTAARGLSRALDLEKKKMQKINIKMVIAFACALYFLVASIIIHFLRPELSFLSEPLSRFAVGEFLMVLTIGLIAIGICEILIGLNVGLARIGSLLLILAGISVIIIGLMKMDIGETVTIGGQIHVWAALSEFTCFPIAVFLIARKIESGTFKTYSLITSLLTISLLGLILLLFNNKSVHVFGLIQKINILAITAWLLANSGSKLIVGNTVKEK